MTTPTIDSNIDNASGTIKIPDYSSLFERIATALETIATNSTTISTSLTTIATKQTTLAEKQTNIATSINSVISDSDNSIKMVGPYDWMFGAVSLGSNKPNLSEFIERLASMSKLLPRYFK